MKPIKYEDAAAKVAAGKITAEQLAEMQKAGLIGPSPLDLRLRDVPEAHREEYRAILQMAESLSGKLSGKYVRIQLATVK